MFALKETYDELKNIKTYDQKEQYIKELKEEYYWIAATNLTNEHGNGNRPAEVIIYEDSFQSPDKFKFVFIEKNSVFPAYEKSGTIVKESGDVYYLIVGSKKFRTKIK